MIWVLILLYGAIGGEVGKSERVEISPFTTIEQCLAAGITARDAPHPGEILAIHQCREMKLP